MKLVEQKEELKTLWDKNTPVYTKAMIDQDVKIPVDRLILAEAMFDIKVELVYED